VLSLLVAGLFRTLLTVHRELPQSLLPDGILRGLASAGLPRKLKKVLEIEMEAWALPCHF
jgi:hypothetical protein